MKRMLCTLAVCLSLAAMLAGCGSKNTAETDTAAETAETEQSAAKELDAQKYAYDYDVEKLVELGDYKGLSYTKVDTSVSKSEINKDIKSTLESYAQPKQIKDRAVKDGDTVFAMTTAETAADVDVVGVLAADVMAKAIARAVRAAEPVKGYAVARDYEK